MEQDKIAFDKIEALSGWLKDQWHDDSDRDDLEVNDWIVNQLEWLVKTKKNTNLIIGD